MLVPQELAVNYALVFDPVSQLLVFPVFCVRYFFMIMLEINDILKLLIPNFFVMVYFLWGYLYFAILWSL